MFKVSVRLLQHFRIATYYPASTVKWEKFIYNAPCNLVIPSRNSVTSSSSQYIKEIISNGSWSIKNAFKKAGIFKKSSLRRNGFYIYGNIADNMDYKYFFEKFNMPDTFHSWFLVMELHVWMVLVRLMAEAEEGRFVRNMIIEAMWEDVRFKAGLLGHENSAMAKKQIKIISEEFQAALLSYDEGLLSDDVVLAGAIWRRFFGNECNDPEQVELLVSYIRKQVRTFDLISREDVLALRKFPWSQMEVKKLK